MHFFLFLRYSRFFTGLFTQQLLPMLATQMQGAVSTIVDFIDVSATHQQEANGVNISLPNSVM